MVSESYELGLGPVAYCKRTNFPVEVFYRYRQQYIKIYGAAVMPNKVLSGSFVALEVADPSQSTGISLEISSHIRLRSDSLPDTAYLFELLKSFVHASFK